MIDEENESTSDLLNQVKNARRPRIKPTTEEINELRNIFSRRWYTTEALRDLEESTGKRFKRGRFTNKEKEILRKGMEKLCQERGLTIEQFLQAFFSTKQRGGDHYTDKRFKKMFVDLANLLDGRPVLLVYQCIRRMYHPGNLRGKWTDEEDQELIHLFDIHGPDWETIGLSMGRYGMSVRDRYRYFRNKGSPGPWTEAEIERLKTAITELRQRTDAPCWLHISEQVQTRSPSQCMTKWALLEMIYRNNYCRPEWTSALEYHLVSCIYNLVVQDESEIVWREVAEENWPVYFHPRELAVRFKLLRKRIRNNHCISMDDVLETLLLHLKPLNSKFTFGEDVPG